MKKNIYIYAINCLILNKTNKISKTYVQTEKKMNIVYIYICINIIKFKKTFF